MKVLFILLLLSNFCAIAASPRALDCRDYGYYMLFTPEASTAILSISLKERVDLEQKKIFWERIQKQERYGHVIWQINFQRPEGWDYKLPPFEMAKRQLDQWFLSDEVLKTTPEKIYAVTLSEENITWAGQLELMNRIGDYVREKFGIKVYQWLSEPLLPRGDIRADGWIVDMYSVKNSGFYAHLESFILYGKPVVPVLWGSGHFDKYFPNTDFPRLTELIYQRMDYCRYFNLPILMFCVTQEPYGSVYAWFTKANDPEEETYRESIRKYLAGMKDASPEITPPRKLLPINLNLQGIGAYTVNGTQYELVDVTEFDSPYHWKMTGEGVKALNSNAVLNWNLAALNSNKIDEAEFTISYSGKARIIFGQNTQELSPTKNIMTLKLHDFVRTGIRLEAEKGFLFKKLDIRCNGTVIRAPKELKLGKNGKYYADAGFEDGSFETSLKKSTSYKCTPWIGKQGIGIEGAQGYVTTAELIQEIKLPEKMGSFTVRANIHADAKNYGAKILCKILAADGTVLAEKASDSNKANQEMNIRAEIPEGNETIGLAWDLSVGCGVATSNRRPAHITNYTMEFCK